MTVEEIDKMEAGHELDALVAERVMGHRYSGGVTSWCREDGKLVQPDGGLPPYSTDISAAWEVVERLRKDWAIRIGSSDLIGNGWGVRMWSTYVPGPAVDAATAPLAISRCALKAVMK